ncbi:Iron-sulfur cluster assembly ATPase protein SufC [hydrothermal vent metagenome]|uniref:Iron-sulfur cluster assembly ATPase protein SufC n=1 Tax=hydrothermal vent metagenome TaxID=652676 RepID=A0A3B0R470_9ZZZZ
MLEIKNLHVTIGGKEILKGLNLTINDGEVHAIMGPNGAGKSTLSYALCGKDGYEVTQGSITYNGKNLMDMDPNERAGEGLFLGFQYPVEIPGVSNMNFLRSALNSQRRYRGEDEIAAVDFLKLIRAKAAELDMDPEMLKRPVNVGFSGGEKKRNEMVQMAVLDPGLAVLDETDSGLDIDALKIVATGINRLRSPDKSILMITHYQRLLDYVVPDYVHILAAGQIVKTGGKELALQLEEKGYMGLGITESAA